MTLFFRMMFSYRRWSSLQLFCSFGKGEMTVQNTSQLFCMHSLSYLLLFAELRVTWEAVQCDPLQHFKLFSSSWTILKSWLGPHAGEGTLVHRDVFPKGELSVSEHRGCPIGVTRRWTFIGVGQCSRAPKKQRPLDWHHATRKCVIKGHNLIVSLPKNAGMNRIIPAKGPAHLSPAHVLVSCSPFFHLHYFLSSCFSCFFSPVILLLCAVCLPSIFLTVALLHLLGWVSLPFFLLDSFFHLFALSLPCKPLTSMWTEGPQKSPVKFNRAHLDVQKVWNGSILGVGASWLMQIRSDYISRGLEWMVWAPPQSICHYFTKHLCLFSSARYRAISKAGTASSHAYL